MNNRHAGLSWNLTMTVIWIAARSSQAVERWKDMPLPALTMENADESDDQADLFNRLNPAKDELWRYLDGGDLTATAIDASGGLVDIAPRMWARLTIKTNSLDDFKHADHTTLIVPGTNTAFTGVEFRSADVFKLWPPMSDPFHMLRQSLAQAAIPVGATLVSSAAIPGQHISTSAPTPQPDDQLVARNAGGAVRGPDRKVKGATRQDQIERAAAALWPDGNYPAVNADFKKLVSQYFSDRREKVPGTRTFDRYFAKRRAK